MHVTWRLASAPLGFLRGSFSLSKICRNWDPNVSVGLWNSFWCGPIIKPLLRLLQYCLCFMFWFFGPRACGILASPPGIKPTPTVLEGEVLTTGPPVKTASASYDSDSVFHWILQKYQLNGSIICIGWHHRLNGRESGWTPGVGDGQGGLACCDSWGRKESDMTEQLNWRKQMPNKLEHCCLSPTILFYTCIKYILYIYILV